MEAKVEGIIGGEKLILQAGKIAKQANGAVWVRYRDTVVLVACVGREMEVEEMPDFFPLTVEYRERTYAGGKIPGGFFKREGRPSEKEIVSSRLIDRPLRPLFEEGLPLEVQIVATALSVDEFNDPQILGIIGASAALAISDLPFPKPIGAVRIGKVGERFKIFPTHEEREQGAMDLVICGWKDGILMVEGEAREVPEEEILEALEIGKEICEEVSLLIEELREKVGKEKREIEPVPIPEELLQKVEELALDEIRKANEIPYKKMREKKIEELKEKLKKEFAEVYPECLLLRAFSIVEEREVRRKILKGERVDGRRPEDLRPVTCEVGVLPRTHGSALFTRGETQALVVATLGSKEDEQVMEALWGEDTTKTFMLHYNFPPFSVGEVRPIRGPGRREIGHGWLAERALKPVMPDWESFPYTVRLVSDILESNGSSSMATVCGGSLALMDAGVPIKEPVAGVAMGLVKEGDKEIILTDILGLEDKYGDMDLKIAGTEKGVTAIQMDIKVKGVSMETLKEAFRKNREARLKVLEIMRDTLPSPRPNISPYAPHIGVMEVPVDKIGNVIGPGGKTIRRIIAETGVKIFVDDLVGKVTVEAQSKDSLKKAMEMIKDCIREVEVGEVYTGKVTRITPFGAFVEIFPGVEGLLHISQITHGFVRNIKDYFKEGDEVKVKVINIDEMGRINLSRKELLEKPPSPPPSFRKKPRR
ncbi:MAG TPA: polyribonucleotide nucleotidyltransferase [bacterium]|nr:polyribonucleotide nucleotidyltransferase [bacterium]HEX68202.1 polyribonucleotide nucleotidyltransferase [bacterium]